MAPPFERPDELLLALRPQVEVLPSFGSEVEAFQHQVLRPVLKLQNDLLREAFIAYVGASGLSLPRERMARFVQEQFRRNLQLKELLGGMVCGMFTRSEHQFYLQHRAEVRKRINSLLLQRLTDQMQKYAGPAGEIE
jgi:hypothetical protein